MPLAPWQAAQVPALAAPAAASPWMGACPRKSSNDAVAASATPTTIATTVIEEMKAARVVKITAAPSQFRVEQDADQVGAVVRLRSEVGVDPMVDHEVVLQPGVVPVGEASSLEQVEQPQADHARQRDLETDLQGMDVVVVVRESIAHRIHERLLGDRQRARRGKHVADPAKRIGVGVTEVRAHASEVVA